MTKVTVLFAFLFNINSINIVSLASIGELSKNDIIIDVYKGFSLRRIGVYSPYLVNDIIHTFIPLKHFCETSPKTNVCLYASLATETSMIPVATVIAPSHSTHGLYSYDKEDVSKLIGKDINRILSHHDMDHMITKTQSIVHFTHNRFHHQSNDKSVSTALSSLRPIAKNSDASLLSTAIGNILTQINRNNMVLEYLDENNLRSLVSATFPSIDTSHIISNVRELPELFKQFIIGQSVFAVRSCASTETDISSSLPCLVVSTLFLRIPDDSASTFFIYRMIPLPIIYNGYLYAYSNLPQVIGVNFVDKTFVILQEHTSANDCTFSSVIAQCKETPIVISFSKPSCLSQLLKDDQNITDKCEVHRSFNIAQDVIRLDDNLWFLYNVDNSSYCQLYARSKRSVETIPVKQASIFRPECGKSITCNNIKLPASSSCSRRQVVVRPHQSSNIQNQPNFIAPIDRMVETLVQSYETQTQKSNNDLMISLTAKKPKLKDLIYNSIVYISSFVFLSICSVLLFVIKAVKHRLYEDMNALESYVNDMIVV